MDFKRTELWKKSLARREPDPHADSRDDLRVAYEKFRKNASIIAAEIVRDNPSLTRHDIDHLDALWSTAGLVVGSAEVQQRSRIELNPIEAFILGSAFLVHDLGNGLAAYSGGLEDIRGRPIWKDTVAALLRQQHHRVANEDELASPGKDIEAKALAVCLREMHAEQSMNIVREPYILKYGWNKGKELYLLDDLDLRESLGYEIGRLAQSHWWPLRKVEENLNRTVGAPNGFCAEWKFDLLVLACLLRTADATHLDRSRAPTVLMAVRELERVSEDHWIFQNKLLQPQLRDNRVLFTSREPFPAAEFEAWWLAHDSLLEVDSELRQVDALLAKSRGSRFDARGVFGVERPRRLMEHLEVAGWTPIDARVHVSDVARIVERFGGRELYGNDPTVPLRELLQNGADAVRARRTIQGDEAGPYRITARIGTSSNANGRRWIEVEDTGVGMSEDVLANALLDFGNPFWGSPRMMREYPEVWSRGFEPIGQYGVGFFSLFMWGKKVAVTSLKMGAGADASRVLEFRDGLRSRPLLRHANPDERLMRSGTRVRIWLEEPVDGADGLFGVLGPVAGDLETKLAALCGWLAPAIDVDLFIGASQDPQVKASDWKTMEGRDLLERLSTGSLLRGGNSAPTFDEVAVNTKPLMSDSGETVGRACILPVAGVTRDYRGLESRHQGVMTVGGLRAGGLEGVSGLIEGRSERISRNAASLLVSRRALGEWASHQAALIPDLIDSEIFQLESAAYIRSCGGDIGDLPVALFGGRQFLSQRCLQEKEDLPREVLAVDIRWLRNRATMNNTALLETGDNVLAVDMQERGINRSTAVVFDPQVGILESDVDNAMKLTLLSCVIDALAKRWGVCVEEIISNSSFSSAQKPIYENVSKVGNIETLVHVIRCPGSC